MKVGRDKANGWIADVGLGLATIIIRHPEPDGKLTRQQVFDYLTERGWKIEMLIPEKHG